MTTASPGSLPRGPLISPHDLDIATRTLFGEARGEGEAGQIAVCWTIRNRAGHGYWWGDSVAEVCQHPSQFSCWNERDPNRQKLIALDTGSDAYADLYEIVSRVMSDEIPDPTGQASHYCVRGLEPAWRFITDKQHRRIGVRQPSAIIGAHEFFKIGPGA
jgi:spore germination cell wall hydrolase CwlJ-like protein